jgi:hypothetical protein
MTCTCQGWSSFFLIWKVSICLGKSNSSLHTPAVELRDQLCSWMNCVCAAPVAADVWWAHPQVSHQTHHHHRLGWVTPWLVVPVLHVNTSLPFHVLGLLLWPYNLFFSSPRPEMVLVGNDFSKYCTVVSLRGSTTINIWAIKCWQCSKSDETYSQGWKRDCVAHEGL